MDLNALLYSFGLSGLFASRAFLPAFATAVALRYGESLPWLRDLEFVRAAGSEPHWFTHGGVIAVLGLLAAAELLADKSPEARELLDAASRYVKPGVSALVTMGALGAADADFVDQLVGMRQAGLMELFPAAAAGALTYFFSTARDGALALFGEADPGDDLGMRGFLSWIEDLWAFFGAWLLLVYALGMGALIGLAMGAFYLAARTRERRAERAKVPCAQCGERIHPFATECRHCGAGAAAPRQLSMLGGLREERAEDIQAHKLRLIELKRSPKSGERFKGRGADAVCEEDGARPFEDPALREAYVAMVAARLPTTLAVGAALSLVPILGLVAGVIYYRFRLVAPFRRYLPLRRSLWTRWLIRLLLLVLMAFQWVPVAGAAVVPLMALINYGFYRRAFLRELSLKGLAENRAEEAPAS